MSHGRRASFLINSFKELWKRRSLSGYSSAKESKQISNKIERRKQKQGLKREYKMKISSLINTEINEILTMESIFDFGKFNGSSVAYAVNEDPSYIEWLINETGHEFDEEVMQSLQKIVT